MNYIHPIHGNNGLREMTAEEIAERETWDAAHSNDPVPIDPMQAQIDALTAKLQAMSAAMMAQV